ncbi:MAG: cytochrome c3 family protein [bacterium]
MAQLFPKWINFEPLAAIMGGSLALVLGVGFISVQLGVAGLFWYFGSPEYTDVSYRPKQPIAYSHKLHAGDLGIDCRYCHSFAEESHEANIPSTQTCMNCHKLIFKESEKLPPLLESWATGKPIEWIRVHKVPDYAYFPHHLHLRAGVGCESCHGNVAEMELVMQTKPLSMNWCLDCHRNPDAKLRPESEITTMNWLPLENQMEFAAKIIKAKNLKPPDDCSACHF